MRTRSAFSGVVMLLACIGQPSPSATAARQVPSSITQHVRRGVVHGDRHAFADAGGPFLARGASLFWGLWGYQHDRARLGRNLATLRDWGFDYIRVLGVVGAPDGRPNDSWRDRRVDPSAASYDDDLAGFTDWVYGEYGLRVQWTIFGGTELVPTPEARRALVQRFAGMSQGRDEKLFAFEIANEAWQNGFPGEEGRAELHTLASILKTQSPALVALSAPQHNDCASVQALYRRSPADLVTLHFSRAGMKDDGFWTVFGEPWALRNCDGVPPLMSSNEPAGPESSVVSVDDPIALSAFALATYGSGVGAFVMHTGAGVRGGGAADVERGRHSNIWEVPSATQISRGLANLHRWLSGDLANWTKSDGVMPDAASDRRPFDVVDRSPLAGLHCFTTQTDYACVAFGIKRPVQLVARRALRVSTRHLVDGTETPVRHLIAGNRFALPASPEAALILGRLE